MGLSCDAALIDTALNSGHVWYQVDPANLTEKVSAPGFRSTECG